MSRFQAIQAAHEVLGDPVLKPKYDNDRRKAGLYPNSTARPAATGNPYAATSAYPPPPRRTQPGTWQRPAAAGAGPTPAPGASGADRFSSFPRPSPTAKKDNVQDRANMFKAWSGVNPNHDRASRNPASSKPTAPQPPPQPQASRPRGPAPPPPPRPDRPMPSEEHIRANMRHTNMPPPFRKATPEQAQSAWANFNQNNAGRPGMARSNTTRTPKKQGFDPNTPGSDERAAPGGGSYQPHAFNVHESNDGRPAPTMPPPPHSGSRSSGTASTSPTSPRSRRPNANPLRPFASHGESPYESKEVPFAEGNRVSTPYGSFIGEKIDPFNESLRRSFSQRDASKLRPEDAAVRNRARSSSPKRWSTDQPRQGSHPTAFDIGSSGESQSGDDNNSADQRPNSHSSTGDSNEERASRSNDEISNRRKATPTPRSSRFRGTQGGSSDTPPPVPTGHSRHESTDGTRADGEKPAMEQRAKSSMYADPSRSSFDPVLWRQSSFGSCSTSRANRFVLDVPTWAVPASVDPGRKSKQMYAQACSPSCLINFGVNVADPDQVESAAYSVFREGLREQHGCIPSALDFEVFLKLVKIARVPESCGNISIDELLANVLARFPSVGFTEHDVTNMGSRTDSFTMPMDKHLFDTTNARSRSEENISTDFSPGGWDQAFTGEPDNYFGPPQGAPRKQSSAAKHAASGRPATSQSRSATFDVQSPTGTPLEELPQRKWGSAGTPNEIPRFASSNASFNSEDWAKHFQDGSWTMPPPPPIPPTASSGTATPRRQSQGRKGSRTASQKRSGSRLQPQVADEHEAAEDADARGRQDNDRQGTDDGDAMDIDNTPPSQHQPPPPHDRAAQTTQNGAKVYPVPRSVWRQQQAQAPPQHVRTPSGVSGNPQDEAGTKFSSTLDDLGKVEPFAKPTSGEAFNVADMTSSLPFQSQAARNVPGSDSEPKELVVPPIPQAPNPPKRISKVTWHTYATAFAQYVKAYHNNFNEPLLQHFQKRELDVQTQMQGGMGWLEATGDTSGMLTGPSGFGNYMRGIREDEKVMEGWKIGCERHADAVKRFEMTRERVRLLVVGSGLVER